MRRGELRNQSPPHERGKGTAVKKKHRRTAALIAVGEAHIAELHDALYAIVCRMMTICAGALHARRPATGARRRREGSPVSSRRQKPRSRIPATHGSAIR